ncbi:SLATT domain-containing protein [Pedobacter planticolens]|uniref:SLATT domain-containing protein n=1 Tax=Pedobacter planticolens TaxID=2679964 RepID=UPI0016019816|nr:SLATT domain-containing protein [Pedobacter planticolens]
MTKDDFLRNLATNGFNIGFGAKKNFASYDIINKLPSWVGFISLGVGVIQMAYEHMRFNKELSILMIIVGIAILYADSFKSKLEEYEIEGIRLTKIFNRLRDMYYIVKADSNFLYNNYENDYQALLNEYYIHTISKQVFMSQWHAHFKFFYEMQIDWVDEQLKFKFFKDKFPNSLKAFFLILAVIFLTIYISNGLCSNI